VTIRACLSTVSHDSTSSRAISVYAPLFTALARAWSHFKSCVSNISGPTVGLRLRFLPRDAMLARYMLSSRVRLSVRPSVRPSQPNNVSKPLDESNWVLA